METRLSVLAEHHPELAVEHAFVGGGAGGEQLGVAAGAPRARAGQRVGILVGSLGRLDNTLVAEEVSA